MEDTGNETDESGEGGDITESIGTIPTSTTHKFGHYSRDFEDGDTEYFTHADGKSTDISGADQPISMVAWVYVESTTGTHNIISKYRASGVLRQYKLFIQDNTNAERVVCQLDDDGASATSALTGDNTITDGNWYHIACVYNDTDIRIYIDGVLASNGADNPKAYTAGIVDATTPFLIGAEGDITNFIGGYFDGKMDDVAIFDDELSAAEVNNIMNYGLTGRRRIFITN